ncbi:GTPase [Brevibacterium sp. BRM-1]|uniref:GTPase n=1 Tax=Brevibacterium sp. BRM-1 TaxID=2999062 RepID=UPI00227F262A|nr:GTPase [Brevibacterium sp. BRM-1]WAL41405.1 GTPase [Brevibacterium sp. BRM-1]
MRTYARELGGLIVPGVRLSPDVVDVVEAPAWAQEDEDFWRLRNALACLQVKRPDAIAAGFSSAYLQGLPVRPGRLEVVVPRGGSRVTHAAVDDRRSLRYEPVEVAGVRVQRLRCALLELAPRLSETDLVVVLDALVGGGRCADTVDLEKLRHFVADERAYKGRAVLLAAVARCRAGVRSPPETRLRLALVDAGLPEPAVAQPIHIRGLGTIHPDLSYDRPRIALEYEGDHHRVDPQQFGYDLQRYFAMECDGWIVLRATKTMARAWIVDQVRRLLNERGAP